jgi:hypothetical protein
VHDDDAFDKWLHQTNNEFVESIAASLNVDDALATVKRRGAHKSQKAASDEQLPVTHNHIREVTLLLGATSIKRARKTKPPIYSVAGRLLASKSLGAVSAAAVGMVFLSPALFANGHPALSQISDLGTSTTAQTSSKPDPGPDGGQPASTARSGSPAGQPTLSGRQPASHMPGNPLLPPLASGTQSAPYPPASRYPMQSGKPTTDSPEIQNEQRVTLSAQPGQDSVKIDDWRQVSDQTGDLQMDQHGIYVVGGAKLSIISNPIEFAYRRCAQFQNWSTRIEFTALREGSHLCAQSSTGQYAMLRIAALPSSEGSHDKFIFYGRIWQCAKAAEVRSSPATTTPDSTRPSTTTRPPAQRCGN